MNVVGRKMQRPWLILEFWYGFCLGFSRRSRCSDHAASAEGVEGILSGGTEENRANVKKRKLFERQGYRGLRGGVGQGS